MKPKGTFEMPTSRRDFFARFLPKDRQPADSSDGKAVPLEAKTTQETAEYIEISRRAMAAEFLIYANAGEYHDVVEVGLEALDEVTRLERLLSCFDENSEISTLNRRAVRDFYEVDSEVYALLRQCNALYRQTNGAFDISATPLSEVWGFMKRQGRLPEEPERQKALACVGSDKIEWDLARHALKLRPGMALSLGSIGKGFALDQASVILQEHGVENFLFHGGSSSVIARGTRRGREDWLVGLHHPLRLGERLMEIPLKDRALGTSGSATQFFWYNGKRYGHVLDPRTGFPADHVLSATVLAPTATEADALATACYVMGIEQTRAFCETRPDLCVIFVRPGKNGNVELVQIVSI